MCEKMQKISFFMPKTGKNVCLKMFSGALPAVKSAVRA
jgi:hypothetical protein